MSLLDISDLRVSYRGAAGKTLAVSNVNLTVDPGEVVAVVGESGSGKSTTADAVAGLLPRGGRIEHGRIEFRGADLSRLDHTALRRIRGRHIGLIPQDPALSLNPVSRIGPQVAEVLTIHRIARGAAARHQAIELLTAAGLPDADVRARQYPHQLSGGMRQRVLIAMALAGGPALVIADEPTSALDVTVQQQVLDQLHHLVSAAGTAVLLITHDLAVAADRADRIVVMSAGQVVESGPAGQILREPTHEYTRRLLADVPSLTLRATPPRPDAVAGDVVLRLEDVGKDFGSARGFGPSRRLTAVAGVSFAIDRGQTFGLVGESGSGKSTVARIAASYEAATSGVVTFRGQDIARLGRREARMQRRRLQLIHQSPSAALDPRFTVGRCIEEPLRAFGVADRRVRRRRTCELLDQVALPGVVLERRPGELSGGQRQRVAIARALAVEPELLICDEPLSALDVSIQAQILRLLARLQRELELTYLFISHDLAVVRQICDHVAVMKRGRIVESGPTERVFAHPEHPYTKALLDAVPGRHTPS
ncbi:dipeptide ABC transporter ATP-binding protein [Kribbella kalugense]|uniref:Peptide/nickel transport system ATP-binding protein n=1 Tax=Kribbella kalugense TaxID=2512221 RepID=A0A4V3G8T6_9ACTN|nr:ABC transporter ATP-binding protein [Kribbella kalugense]TDW24184.1 peptide/nickel transport system ATP-binding protein [Kribbella kalugense]